MPGKLKGYTTSVPGEKSISEIEQLLLEFGAENFIKKAEKCRFTGIMFTFPVNDKQLPFKLPANIEKVQTWLYREHMKKVPKSKKTIEDFGQAAYNVAWRIIKEWVHAQISIIATEMVTAEEVFMPYLVLDCSTGETLSDKMSNKGFMNKLQIPEFTR